MKDDLKEEYPTQRDAKLNCFEEEEEQNINTLDWKVINLTEEKVGSQTLVQKTEVLESVDTVKSIFIRDTCIVKNTKGIVSISSTICHAEGLRVVSKSATDSKLIIVPSK